MKYSLALLAALLPLAASAQSFFPNLYGMRYCQLRRMGVPAEQARIVAMQDAYSEYRRPVPVVINGTAYTTDVIEAAQYVRRNCPEGMRI